MASNFSGLRKLGPDSDIVDVARIQGELAMNASIAYFFGGGSVKYAEIPCGSVNLVVFLQVLELNAQRIS